MTDFATIEQLAASIPQYVVVPFDAAKFHPSHGVRVVDAAGDEFYARATSFIDGYGATEIALHPVEDKSLPAVKTLSLGGISEAGLQVVRKVEVKLVRA